MTNETAPVPAKKQLNLPEIRPYPGKMRLHYRLSQYVLRFLFRLFTRTEFKGLENVPPTGSLLILATHASFIDPPLVGSWLPRESYYLARDSIVTAPFLGWLVKKYNTYPIRRGASDREALRSCQRILKNGWSMTFFPEGTRSADGRVGHLKPGFLMILDGLDNVPYLPVVIEGNYEVWPRQKKWPRPGKVCVNIGPAATLPPREEGEAKRAWYNRCLADLEARYRELGADFGDPSPDQK